MISKTMQEAFNQQVNAELYSWYLYQSMAGHFASGNLPGFAAWMTAQANEEMTHAMKLCGHLQERGGRVTLTAIEAPPSEWDSPRDVFEAVYEHEQKVTGLIHNLVAQAREEKDYAAEVFLQWFVSEQVEEEDTASSILEKLKLAGDATNALLMLDRELSQRGAE